MLKRRRIDQASARTRRRPVHRPLIALCVLLGLLAAGLPATVAAEVEPAAASAAEPAPVERAVTREIANQGSTDFWVDFEAEADLSAAEDIEDWAERGQFVYDQLITTAKASQAELVEELTAQGVDHEKFWITNSVLVRDGDQAALDLARTQSSVREIRTTHTYESSEPVRAGQDAGANDVLPNELPWGIADIGADRVWSEFGVEGEGIVVGSIDAGVFYDHPALVNQYRGNLGDGSFDHNYNWWDPTRFCNPGTGPCDSTFGPGGTATTGVMVGDDGAGSQIGVAPGAQWIAAGCGLSAGCSDTGLLSAGQFMLAPTDLQGQNPRPELRPHIVNNSWAGNRLVEDPGYDDIVDAWAAAGIFGVFSTGDRGPGCDTTGSAADSEQAWGVGAYATDNQIASFSGRGPGANGSVKPNIAAPGVAIQSSGGRPEPERGYATFNGTAMAAPHVSGAVALLWSASPTLIGDINGTRQLLAQSAADVEDTSCGGTPESNNVWGEGRLDAYAAVGAALGPTGTLTGTVTDSVSDAGFAGATVAIANAASQRTALTGADGTYRVRVPVGTFQVHAEADGYFAPPVAVEITEDQTTTQDFVLEPVPGMTVRSRSLTSWQRPDETVRHALRIGNDGLADLAWRVVGDGAACGTTGTPPWAAVDPSSGSSLAPGDEQELGVVFDSTGLADGERRGDLCLESNDPKRPWAIVSLELVVDEVLPGDWVQRDKITPSVRTDRFDGFGWQVEVDGDTAVVLACDAPGGSSAFVYGRTAEGVWREQARLTPSVPAAACSAGTFGIQGSIAIDGDTVLLGLPLAPPFEAPPGTVTVFTRSGDQWTEQAQFSDLLYGFEVAIDGDTAFTTGLNPEGNGLTFHVFQREGADWSKQGEFVMPDDARPEGFPELDVDGDTAVANRLAFDDTPASEERAVIFSRSGDEWTFEAELAPSDGAERLDFAQHEVSLDGDTAVVTASRQGGVPPLAQSAVYVFTRDVSGWQQQQKLLPDTPDDANWRAVAIDGDRIVVGAEAFGVHVWNRVGDRWRQHAIVVPAGGADADGPPPDCQPNVPCFLIPGRFGRSVALDGDTLVASTYPLSLFGSGNGPAYVFDTGEPAPTVGLTPRAADFGAVTVDTVSDSETVTVENTGSADMALGTLSVTGENPGDFALADDFCSGRVVAPGRGCTYEVRFTPGPRSLGERTAQVHMPSNASTAPDTVTVTGEGMPAPAMIDVLPDRFAAEMAQGSRMTKPLLVANRGTTDLEWSVFPDPTSAEALTLRPVGKATAVSSSSIDLDQVALARLTTGVNTGAAPTPSSSSPNETAAAPGTVTLSHSRSLDVAPGNTARCANADGSTAANQYLRTFTLSDFGVKADLEITGVSFGVEALSAPVDMKVNVYLLVGEFSYANLRRLATETVSLQPQAQTMVTVPVSAVAPAGSTLVLEIAAPHVQGVGGFSAGSNRAGESSPSYIASAECGIAEPTRYSQIGFPDTHLVMTMSGRVECAPSWLEVNPDGGTVGGDDSQLAEVTFDTAGLAPGEHAGNLCLTSNDPRRPLTTVPVTLQVTEAPPVTFDSLRDRVTSFRADGDVTGVGANRLLDAVDDAERHHDRSQNTKAIKTLERFQKIANDHRYVPTEHAREVLVTDAEQLITKLRESANDGQPDLFQLSNVDGEVARATPTLRSTEERWLRPVMW